MVYAFIRHRTRRYGSSMEIWTPISALKGPFPSRLEDGTIKRWRNLYWPQFVCLVRVEVPVSLTSICCLPSGSLSLNLFISHRSCQPISSFDYFRFIYIALSNDKPHILLSHQWYLIQPLLCWEQAGGSLRKEQTIHPLARFAYSEGANNPWEQRSATLRRSSGNGPDDLNWLVHSAIWLRVVALPHCSSDNETDEILTSPTRDI